MKNTKKQPRGITGFLIRFFVKNYNDTQDKNVRARYGILEGWISCVLNGVLALIKLVLGIWIHSSALIADAVHSLGDMVTSIIVIFGFTMSKKPRDREHPFGHANAEVIASLIMSILLIVTGFEILRFNAVKLVQQNFVPVETNTISIVLVALTIGVKEWLTFFSRRLGQIIKSTALEVEGWHHRLDSLTTVIVLVGIIASGYGAIWLDAVAGIVVALVILWVGIDTAKSSISPLLGESVSIQKVETIRDIAMQEELILDVHDILVHSYGSVRFSSMHVEFSAQVPSIVIHDVSARISEEVMRKFGGDCIVHVDPIEHESPRYKEVSLVLDETVQSNGSLIDFHDLQFREIEEKEHIRWEFSVDPDVNEKNYPGLKRELAEKLQPLWRDSVLHFTLEPGFNVIPTKLVT